MTGPEDEPDPDDDEPGPVNLSAMTKAELLQYAEDNEIQGITKDMKKSDIITAIEG